MKHLRAINQKAHRVEESVAYEQSDVFALQQGPDNSRPNAAPHYPVGCTIVFSPGWEVDSAGGTAGLCQPAERDLYDCYATCFWPAQVPDHLNNYPDWTKKCAAATKDWRNIELVFLRATEYLAMKKLLLFCCMTMSAFGADTMLYMGTWPQQVLQIDEKNYGIVKRIEMKTDVPRLMVLTKDRSKLVVMTLKNTGIETVDLAKGEVTDSFELGDSTTRVAMAGMAIDPSGNFIYANIKISKKLIDRWEIGEPELSVIDIKQHKIVEQVPIPLEEQEAAGGHRGGNYRVSPDGKLLYQFGREIAIYDTQTLKKVQTINLTKPSFPDMENITFAPEVDPNDDDDTLTGIFNTQDPEVHRQVFGIATVHLNERKFDFKPVAPAVEGVSNIRFTPDHKVAYAVAITGLHGDRRCEFWAIDAATTRLKQRQEFACRPRFSFATSSTGKDLFIYSAGFELEVYDAASMQLQKTISMDADITTPMVTVIPPDAARASR